MQSEKACKARISVISHNFLIRET